MTDKSAPSESVFVAAAAKNIRDLQRAVVDLQRAAFEAKSDAKIAKDAASEAKQTASRWQTLTRWLGVVVLVALIASGLSIYNWAKAADSTSQLRAQAIASCQAGNAQRAAEVSVWNHILAATLAGSKQAPPAQQKATIAFVKDTERFLTHELAPRNCALAYSAKGR